LVRKRGKGESLLARESENTVWGWLTRREDRDDEGKTYLEIVFGVVVLGVGSWCVNKKRFGVRVEG
jgi:hypothetical protein